ncbi:uncharacterized protein BJ171DRAFT_475362 [Polychytrium aggregatum]|uniref:uncharacterized protein n=1 Tax=Polychytrium aggregatum TaxID=110093 RepID=UPI0022FF01B5|nr:uncharacterized protein BJ171DRAFT_475362 [Polychytrium aggregatum]KAI9204022.1 hypothetical protein BJ171DRAFT_475362 [Polychytrium aggregatum]
MASPDMTGPAQHRVAKAAISFTGGKDSVLALHLVHAHPEQHDSAAALSVVGLVTFSPAESTKPFLSHPIPFIQLQADSLALPHSVSLISDPFLESYSEQIRALNTRLSIEHLVTGDIEDVCNGFMTRAVEPTPVKLVTPLWQRPRSALIQQFRDFDMRILVTCANLRLMREPLARRLVGAVLTDDLWDELLREEGVDACGEGGEYHTMVLDATLFRKRLEIADGEQCVSDCGNYLYFQPGTITAVEKT